MTTGFERYTKKMRPAIVLEEMEQVVHWTKLCVLIEPHHPKPDNERRPEELEQMLRYRKLKKNAHRLFLTRALVNLFISGKKFPLRAA